MNISSRANLCLSMLAVALGIGVALSTLTWGPWNDEFWTLAATAKGITVHEFLGNMSRDQHPIFHYGLIYLAQTIGISSIPVLRSLNVLGLVVVAAVLAYAHRQKTINATQIMLIATIYASSPLSFSYFSELRAYFLLYSASISVSILWLMLSQRVGEGRPVPASMIAAWGTCLALFVNLHYFATIFGGILTLALLATLAWRRLWRLSLILAVVSFAAALPALALGAVQSTSSLSGQMGWITTTFRQAIDFVVIVVEKSTAFNVPVIACAIIAAVLPIEDRALRRQRRNILTLLVLAALFFTLMVGLNALMPLIWDRYLLAAAGAVTVAVALLGGGAGSPKWIPAAAAIVAMAWQIYATTWLDYTGRGFTPTAAAIAQATAECPPTKVFVLVPSEEARTHRIAFQYYGEKYKFPYTEITSTQPVAAGGACPSLVWIWGSRADGGKTAAQIVRDYDLRVQGDVALKLFDSEDNQILLAVK